MWKLPDWGSASGWNVPTMYYIIIMDYASVITLDEQHACNECSNTQTHRIQKYVNWTTSDFTVRPQILLSDLRIYSTTSEFTVRPQNLQYDLRIYSTTSEFTVRPQNLQYDLRIYSTTSEFYCPTWVFVSSNFSTTWPGGSVLIIMIHPIYPQNMPKIYLLQLIWIISWNRY